MEKKLGIMFFFFVVVFLQFSELLTAQRPFQVDKEDKGTKYSHLAWDTHEDKTSEMAKELSQVKLLGFLILGNQGLKQTMAMEITQLLVASLSADTGVRTKAEECLRQFQEHNLPQFLLSLSFELANDDKPLESRRVAGTLLINSLDASKKDILVHQWIALNDTEIKSQIKNLLLITLASSSDEGRHTSSKVIAKVASIEIPLKQRPELVTSLLNNMSQQISPARLKQSTLETLGYICEEIFQEDFEREEVNSILQAIYYGTVQSETNTQVVRLAAIKALRYALDIAQTNFENGTDHRFIMMMVFDAAKSQEGEIRRAAFECLISIASLYYEVLDSYMNNIFQLTVDVINGGDEESVALKAVEFWSTICNVEIELQEFENPDPNDWSPPHSAFIKRALPHLVPMLLETLLKQGQGDDNIWNISMACGNCLVFVARTVGEDIVPFMRSFVEAKISEPHWSSREAAMYVLRSIFDQPTFVKLDPLVYGALKFSLMQLIDTIL